MGGLHDDCRALPRSSKATQRSSPSVRRLRRRRLAETLLGTRGFLRKRGKNFDIIHLHSFRTYQNVVAWQEARHFGTPYVFSAHGSIPRIVRKRLTKSLFDVIAGRRFLHDASRLIAVSRAE